MRRDALDPEDTGGFEGGVGIETSGDGAVDDGLLLLTKQRDQLSFCSDESIDLPIRMIQKAHNGCLFVGGRKERFNSPKVIGIKSEAAFNHACRCSLDAPLVEREAQKFVVIPREGGFIEAIDTIRRLTIPS